MSSWQKVGEIGVDAGICWIGDPCYVFHKASPPDAIGKDWHDFCDKLTFLSHNEYAQQFGSGLGVCVSTGYGDGTYPVEVKIKDGRVKEVRVKFF